MSCYEVVQVNTESQPLMKSVDALYFLTISVEASPQNQTNSERLSNPSTLEFMEIASSTFIQFNNWYRSCKKENVTTTGKDLVHAYVNVCKHAANLNFNRILICEDDSQIISTDFQKDMISIDTFIEKEDPTVYTLGSLACTVPTNSPHKRALFMGFSQAVIWSKRARDELLRNHEDVNHIDVGFLSKLDSIYTYHKPVIVQRFTTTENMDDWCIQCKGGKLEKIAVEVWVYILQDVMGLKTGIEGWNIIYNINNYWILIILIIIILLNVLIILPSLQK
tara:strand:+ start:1296 stop:2132 length:837 start_codon:yes stop_codon:yes gene_type:complete